MLALIKDAPEELPKSEVPIIFSLIAAVLDVPSGIPAVPKVPMLPLTFMAGPLWPLIAGFMMMIGPLHERVTGGPPKFAR